MSLSVALNTAVSGLFANQQAIAATSENIANVNTPNFSRRDVNFFTDAIPGQFAGVSVAVTRAGADRFLQGAGLSSQADAAALNAIANALSRVEASLGAPGDDADFATALSEAYASFAELSAAPNSIAAKAVAISKLNAAFAAFSRTIGAIDSEAIAADGRLQAQSTRANQLLEDIFNLNQIAPESNGAADEIDARLTELSALINISVSRGDDGRVTVSTADGRLLANSGGYAALTYAGGSAATIGLANVDPGTGAQTTAADTINVSITGGEIGGLLQLRNSELPTLRAIVEAAARDAANAINSAYALNASVGQTGPGATPLIVEANGGFSVNAAIAGDPSQLAIARPSTGQVGGANDGTGAGAIAALGNGVNVQNAAQAVTQVGGAARIAGEQRATAVRFAEEIEIRRVSDGGVNIDEELSNLIQFQRSYNANARVIAAVDELYQSLFSIL